MYPPFSMESELSNEKQVGCLGDLLGMILPSHVGDYLENMLRIPIKEPG